MKTYIKEVITEVPVNIESCVDCPDFYDVQSICEKTQTQLTDTVMFPDWCPLPDCKSVTPTIPEDKVEHKKQTLKDIIFGIIESEVYLDEDNGLCGQTKATDRIMDEIKANYQAACKALVGEES